MNRGRRPVAVRCASPACTAAARRSSRARCASSACRSAIPAGCSSPGADNPKGYFEVQAIVQLDDELLAHLGGAWDQPPVLDPGWEHDAGPRAVPRARGARSSTTRFGPGGGAAAGDRLEGPAPLAAAAVLANGHADRDDDRGRARPGGGRGVARACAAYAVGAAQAASLWLRYLFAATADDPGHLLVRHADIFDDLPGTIARLAAHLGLPAPDAAAEAAVREHLDTGLRHHDAATARRAELDNPLLDLARGGLERRRRSTSACVPPVVADLLGAGLAAPADRRRAARPRPRRRGRGARDAAQDQPAGRDARGAARRARERRRRRLTSLELSGPRARGRGRSSARAARRRRRRTSQSSRRSSSVSGRRPGSVDGRLLVAEAHPLELGRHEVGRGADVAQRVVVHAARVVVDVVVEHDQEPVAEALAVRLEARGVPAARDDPELVAFGRRRAARGRRAPSRAGSVPPSMWCTIADCARSIGLRSVAIRRTSGSVSSMRSDTTAGRWRQNM